MKNAEEYSEIIMLDEREKIVSETPTIYTDDQIERVYTFPDGAVVKYEWQSFPLNTNEGKAYNHRFTLITLPNPNSYNFKEGVIKQIDYGQNSR